MRFSFPTLQRGNAVLDALRRKEDAEHPERHVDAERRTIVVVAEIIVPYAPVDCPQEVGHQSDLMGVFKWPSIQSNSSSPSLKPILQAT
ncbi:hypothetical protein DND90_22870 [Pseudomonas syringae pv. maculicola]|nr:hypothetical protein DND90_22870 [Pseudomonas syringae pv. maculicola]